MMTLSQDELREVFEKYARCSIDMSQGMNYLLASKYEEGIENFLQAITALGDIITKIKS